MGPLSLSPPLVLPSRPPPGVLAALRGAPRTASGARVPASRALTVLPFRSLKPIKELLYARGSI